MRSFLKRVAVLVAFFNFFAGAATASERFIIQVKDTYPIPTFPNGASVTPDGFAGDTDGMRHTIHTYYCERSSDGFFIKDIAADSKFDFDNVLNLTNGILIANSGSEYMFRATPDGPLQYCSNLDLMTNSFKNGFLPFQQRANGILGLFNGLGIDDLFNSDTNSAQGDALLHLRLASDTNISCLGALTVSNATPISLSIQFTNKMGDLMNYLFEYENANIVRSKSYDSVHLTVSNSTLHQLRLDRLTQLLSWEQIVDHQPLAFGFDLLPSMSSNAVWVWDGDKITGMDSKLDLAVKQGFFSHSTPSKTKRFLMVALLIVIIFPPVYYLYRRSLRTTS